jgi:hypothetical protein
LWVRPFLPHDIIDAHQRGLGLRRDEQRGEPLGVRAIRVVPDGNARFGRVIRVMWLEVPVDIRVSTVAGMHVLRRQECQTEHADDRQTRDGPPKAESSRHQ